MEDHCINPNGLSKSYDIIIAGGGVTGAGVFYEAVRRGYKALLVEARDFAWGTSSRSSKMVHGGLRYLKQGRFLMTKAAVRERQFLLSHYSGLVTPLHFIMPMYDRHGPSESAMKIGLSVYSLMAKQKQHQKYTRTQVIDKVSGIRQENLISAVGFKDAQVDDTRLVLRLIYDACRMGGTALNYTKLACIDRDGKGRVSAVHLLDQTNAPSREIKTNVVVNATGAFAEELHPSPVKGCHMRPLRGSHLVFPRHLIPIDHVISFFHPRDCRPVFLFPWEGAVFMGTTDVDHGMNLKQEPQVTVQEAEYLMEGLHYILPASDVSINDCIASIAGVRPILSRKKKEASQESREHVVWKDKGLITVTGGKLTTFRLLAKDALKACRHYLKKSEIKCLPESVSSLEPSEDRCQLPENVIQRLMGRYGSAAVDFTEHYNEDMFETISRTTGLWVELAHAAKNEHIHHLSDLLLRRVRIGLVLPKGGRDLLDQIETVCSPYLSWDKHRWEIEKKEYINTWQNSYSPPVPWHSC